MYSTPFNKIIAIILTIVIFLLTQFIVVSLLLAVVVNSEEGRLFLGAHYQTFYLFYTFISVFLIIWAIFLALRYYQE